MAASTLPFGCSAIYPVIRMEAPHNVSNRLPVFTWAALPNRFFTTKRIFAIPGSEWVGGGGLRLETSLARQ